MNGGESSDAWTELLEETQPVPVLSLILEAEIDALLAQIGE